MDSGSEYDEDGGKGGGESEEEEDEEGSASEAEEEGAAPRGSRYDSLTQKTLDDMKRMLYDELYKLALPSQHPLDELIDR